MQVERDWDERFRQGTACWEDETIAPATVNLLSRNLSPGTSVLEIGCGLGVNALWLAGHGYQVTACDISATAVQTASERARRAGLSIDFRVANVLSDGVSLLHCDVAFDRGVLHTFVTDEGRSRFARAVAGMLATGELWLDISGGASTPQEAEEAARQRCARLSLSQIVGAVEPYFDVLSVERVTYGVRDPQTTFAAFACAFRRR